MVIFRKAVGELISRSHELKAGRYLSVKAKPSGLDPAIARLVRDLAAAGQGQADVARRHQRAHLLEPVAIARAHDEGRKALATVPLPASVLIGVSAFPYQIRPLRARARQSASCAPGADISTQTEVEGYACVTACPPRLADLLAYPVRVCKVCGILAQPSAVHWRKLLTAAAYLVVDIFAISSARIGTPILHA